MTLKELRAEIDRVLAENPALTEDAVLLSQGDGFVEVDVRLGTDGVSSVDIDVRIR